MLEIAYLIFVAVLFLAAYVAAKLKNRAGTRPSGLALPPELNGARLVLCEPKDNLYVSKPFELHGRPDEVYGVGERLVVLDTKERNIVRAYDDDVVKLSAYASILRNHPKYRKYGSSPHAYLRIVNRATRHVTFVKVALLNDAQLLMVKNRRDRIVSGSITPRTSTNRNFCRGCAQRPSCPSPCM